MSFFRSQTMQYFNLVIPRESAWNVMNELAEIDCIHFIDYDPFLPTINRPFANYVKRCDDLLNRLLFIESELNRYKKKITYCTDVRELSNHYKSVLRNRNQAQHTYFQELEADVEKKGLILQEQTKNLETLCERRNQLIEHRAILLKGEMILGKSYFQQRSVSAESNINIGGKGLEDIRSLQQTVRFNQIVGAINKEDELRFKRIVFRVTKGNIWINMIDVDQEVLFGNELILDPINDKPILKTVFVLVYPGNGLGIQSKLTKIVENFGSRRYEFPENNQQYQKLLQDIDSQLNETKNLIALTKNQIDSYLEDFSKISFNCSQVQELKLYVLREKYLYTHLNLMKMQGSIFCGYMWLPEGGEIQVERVLRQVQQQFENLPSGQLQQAKPVAQQVPPTYFKLNDFTWTFQEIVNTYGIPRYKEINPGLFTCVTFPFLFGVMFGDIGHGLCLFMFGLYLVLWNHEISKSDSLIKQLLPARHMFLMMGFFAFYNGWIYNDFISLSVDMFGSCYKLENEIWLKKDPCTYPIGVDPVWSVSANELTFVNSYKMKLSVIIGVIHMSSGILLKGVNSIYFSNWLDFIFEFIPQIVFMTCTFGFMDSLVVYKWLHLYEPSQAPSVITLLINMALDPFAPVKPPLWGDGVSEQKLSFMMLVTAMVCVPLMLFPKPLIQNYLHQRKHKSFKPVNNGEESNSPSLIPLLDHNFNIQENTKSLNTSEILKETSGLSEHDDFGEIFVHQVIETIEFVLGSISNTASYLRLWALSLAHGQLSEVFFGMTLSGSINNGGFGGFFGLIIGYVLFSMTTFGVLMMMDVMECFLHALRLHWVEFQNKFYKADGYSFVPYSYSILLKEAANPPPS